MILVTFEIAALIRSSVSVNHGGLACAHKPEYLVDFLLRWFI